MERPRAIWFSYLSLCPKHGPSHIVPESDFVRSFNIEPKVKYRLVNSMSAYESKVHHAPYRHFIQSYTSWEIFSTHYELATRSFKLQEKPAVAISSCAYTLIRITLQL
jgi:hypothetical protein